MHLLPYLGIYFAILPFYFPLLAYITIESRKDVVLGFHLSTR